jgi:hypothetical protein
LGDENESASDDHDEEKRNGEGHKPWGLLNGFTLLVDLAILLGVLFFIQLLYRSVF